MTTGGARIEMARTNPFEFLQQVRTEVAKVTWPTRRETVITTIMVIIMSVAAALFFLAADWVFSTLVTIVFGLSR
jgi:preprotein translocase subunit SecE